MKNAELKVGPGSSLVFLFAALLQDLWEFESTLGGIKQKTGKELIMGEEIEFNI